MATTTNLTMLKINYLTQQQYDTALANGQINSDELYLTPQGASTPASHTHGNITNDGAITTTATIATGDKLVITDSNDSSKLKASSISFGTTTSSFLSNDGTWKQPAKYGTSLPSSGDFVGQIFVLTE